MQNAITSCLNGISYVIYVYIPSPQRIITYILYTYKITGKTVFNKLHLNLALLSLSMSLLFISLHENRRHDYECLT